MITVSAVIPTLEAEHTLESTMASVKGYVDEIVVCDGMSLDNTVAVAEEFGAKVVIGDRGRGQQMHCGVEVATGDWLLLLHADTILEDGWVKEMRQFIAREHGKAAVFRFALDDRRSCARIIEIAVALRNRLFALPYGDQGLLISQVLYTSIGGYKPIPLFEDVDIIRRLGRRRIKFLRSKAITSAVRYRREGFCLRSVKNIILLLFYFLGVVPQKLAKLYK